MFLIVYLLSRSRLPVLGSWLLILCISTVIFPMASNAENPVSGLIWVVFPVLLSATLLPMWAMILVVALNLAASVLYVAISADAQFSQAATPLLATTFAGLMALSAKYVRDRDVRVLEQQGRELADSQKRYRRFIQ